VPSGPGAGREQLEDRQFFRYTSTVIVAGRPRTALPPLCDRSNVPTNV
jgi:hypothetical protein